MFFLKPKKPRFLRFFDFQVRIFTFFMSNSVNLFEFIRVLNVQHSSARVNLRVCLLLDRIRVSSVPRATVHMLKPKKP